MARDEEGTAALMAAYRDVMAGRIRAHGGRVVDAVGDNLLAEFHSVVDSVACAAEIQSELAERNSLLEPERGLSFRIGIHLGDVLAEEDRLVGDGINVAARLEQLSEPGGICLSRAAFEQVEGKLPLEFEDLGERELKNLRRPVGVYRVASTPAPEAEASAGDGRQSIAAPPIPGFSGRPAIAVLPFDNMSDDPEQEYFADGIAEDLITRLSSLWLPVIARNSSFAYKGRSLDLEQVSQELGVGFIVEGSVRRSGGRVRIAAGLVDTTSGQHVWADRYDREIEDVLAVQDEISESIVGVMAPELLRFLSERAAREPVATDAWDLVLEAHWHLGKATREGNAKARALLERATELDPGMALAFGALAGAHFQDYFFGWSDSPENSLARLGEAARKSLEIDPREPTAHLATSYTHRLAGRPDQELASLEQTLELNPSFMLAYYSLGLHLAMANRPEEAIATLEKGLRLSPKDQWTWMYFFSAALAHFAAKRYEEALRYAWRSLDLREQSAAYRAIAVSNAYLGRLDEARSALAEARRLQPDFSIALFRLTSASADPDWVEHYVAGLRRAGLKE